MPKPDIILRLTPGDFLSSPGRDGIRQVGLLSGVGRLLMAIGRGRQYAFERNGESVRLVHTDGQFLTDQSNGLREVDILAHDGEHLFGVCVNRDSLVPTLGGAQGTKITHLMNEWVKETGPRLSGRP